MTYKICAFCRFWQSDKAEAGVSATQAAVETAVVDEEGAEAPDRRAKIGLCRRAAPRPGPNAGAVQWPQTAQRDWCGEWEGRDIEYRSHAQRLREGTI